MACVPGARRSSCIGGDTPRLRPSTYTSPHGVTANVTRPVGFGGAAAGAGGVTAATVFGGTEGAGAGAADSDAVGMATAGCTFTTGSGGGSGAAGAAAIVPLLATVLAAICDAGVGLPLKPTMATTAMTMATNAAVA